MVEESIINIIIINTKEIILMENTLVKEFYILVMEKIMKEILKMVKSMELE